MPQMAPYNWLILFFLFNMIIIIIISYNHYHYLNSNMLKNFNKNFKSYTWMW